MARYDSIFEEVLKIPISEVFFKYGFHPKKCGASWQLASPFRKDSSTSSFTLSDKKNLFKDWVAKEYMGNSINFVQKYYNLTYFEACMDIALKFGVIKESAYKKILSRKPSKREIMHYEVAYKAVEKRVHNPADNETLDKVYRIFLSFCSLSDTHKEHLLNERCLDEETIIEHMFFTFPTRSIVRKFVKEIETQFGSQDVLKDVPGFFKRKNEKNFTFNSSKGIGIPIFNESKQIIGIQLRLDELSKSGLRYMWFSSSFADVDEDDPNAECLFGTSSGSPIDVVFPKELSFKGIFITEGKFKALKLAEKYNCITLSLQGVSTWAPILNCINKLPGVVKNKNLYNGDWKIKRIYSAFDADMSKNINVYKQLYNMTNKISESIPMEIKDEDFDIQYLYWDVEIAKGIDDLLNVSSDEELKTRLKLYYKIDFDEAYNKLIKKVMELNPEIKEESSISTFISADEFKEYFEQYFVVDEVYKREKIAKKIK
jgi:hypothetical protein